MKHIILRSLFSCFFFAVIHTVVAQPAISLRIVTTDQVVPLPETLTENLPKQFQDSLSLRTALRDWVLDLHGRSYLEASVDTLAKVGSEYIAFVHLGGRYQWASLQNGNVDPVFLDQVGYRDRLFAGRPFSYQQATKLLGDLLEYAENNGYPFARVYLDQIRIDGDRISAALMLEKGPLITIGEIEVVGNLKLSPVYLSRYLGLSEGDLYNHERVLRLRERLRELPFVQIQSDPVVAFRGDRANIRLALSNRSASRFDFLIGVLPNSQQSGRLLITGDFTAELQNQFGLGERLFVAFEQLRPQTQQLNLQFNYPYVFDLPFGTDLSFDLYKRDTTYLDLDLDFGLQYLLDGRDYLKAYGNSYTSTLLTVDTQRIRQTGILPDTLDVRRTGFGLEYFHEALDYRFNPRKGWSVFVRAGAAVRRLPRNNLIRQLDIPDPYNGLPERSFQYRILSRVATFLPLFRQSTLKLQLQGGYIISNLGLLANEQFRIGGAKLLRGFDEEFIFASNYTVATLEYRLLIGPNAYLYTFGDLARVDKRTVKTPEEINPVNFPYGLGAGITFETSVGLFGINLAFGADRQTQIDLGAPKVHFGYVSRF